MHLHIILFASLPDAVGAACDAALRSGRFSALRGPPKQDIDIYKYPSSHLTVYLQISLRCCMARRAARRVAQRAARRAPLDFFHLPMFLDIPCISLYLLK